MNKIKCVLLAVLFMTSSLCFAQSVIEKMYNTHAKEFRKSMSFIQETAFYRNDSIVRKATWYEVISYPDKLRIDINDPLKGNTLFFVNDSLYNFQSKQLRSTTYQPHDLLFVLGGMYSYPLKDVISRLQKIGYNTNQSFETSYKGVPVIVLGTDREELESNQIWIDKVKLVPIRILENKGGQKSEIICSKYVKLGNHWCETMVEIFVNGKLRQTEAYTQLKENVGINMEYFNPAKIGEVTFW